MLFFILLIIQATVLYFLSRQTINEIFYFLRLFIKNEKTNYTIVTILFLPGTVLHEFSHFFAATGLFIRVRELKILPEYKDDEIKLGHVLYEKQDIVRGVLIGIAPLLGAMFMFWCLAYFNLFPNASILVSFLLAYLIFAVSATMFSSRQDLVDLIFIIPFILTILVIIYVFDIRLDLILNNRLLTTAGEVVKRIDLYFLFCLIIHISIILILKLFGKSIK